MTTWSATQTATPLARERELVVNRFFALPRRDQLAAYSVIRAALAEEVEENEDDRRSEARAATVDAMAQVAAELGLGPGEAPTPQQFDQTAKRLGLDTNRSRVIRAWGKWRFAKIEYLGRTPANTRSRGHRAGQTRASAYEGHLASIRLWLESNPLDRRLVSYDNWARAYNRTPPGKLRPVPLRPDISGEGYNVSWLDLVAIAADELKLEQAAPRQKKRRERYCRGPYDLVSYEDIVELVSKSRKSVRLAMTRPDFPTPVVVLPQVELYLRDDIVAYTKRRPFPSRRPNELRELYLTVKEAATLKGVTWRRIDAGRDGAPRPSVRRGSAKLWLREEIDTWQPTPPALRKQSLRPV